MSQRKAKSRKRPKTSISLLENAQNGCSSRSLPRNFSPDDEAYGPEQNWDDYNYWQEPVDAVWKDGDHTFRGAPPENDSDAEEETSVASNQELADEAVEEQSSSEISARIVDDSYINVKIGERERLFQEHENANTLGKEMLAADSPLSVSEFCQQLQGLVSQASMDEVHVLKLLGILRNAFPTAKIPARISSRGNVISDLKKSLPPTRHLVEIGACINDCYVFTNQSEIICPVCKEHRYYENSKTNRKSIYYRSIISIITELLTHKLFLRMLGYRYVKPAEKKKYENMDVLDGENAQKHLREMNNNFKSQKFEDGINPVEVNILLSVFYDGIQLFRKKVVNYWPLLCTILNLPPSLRTKIGAGMFLLTAFHGKMDSATENFLF